jgi:transcriptional antiterminator RfaH
MEHWYILKTKPNREFVVRAQLGSRDIEAYLPLWKPAYILNSGKKLQPYFPSYLFTRVDLEDVSLSSLVYMPGVNYMLMCDGEPIAVEQVVIDELRERIRLLDHSVTDARGKLLTHGDRIQVTGGVFEGYEAIFDKRLSAGDRVRILIDFMQKRTPVSIERNMIEKQP